jgi:hypothetical protein
MIIGQSKMVYRWKENILLPETDDFKFPIGVGIWVIPYIFEHQQPE